MPFWEPGCGSSVALGGRLVPGDIYIRRDKVTLFLPVASCLAASIIAALSVWLVFRARKL